MIIIFLLHPHCKRDEAVLLQLALLVLVYFANAQLPAVYAQILCHTVRVVFWLAIPGGKITGSEMQFKHIFTSFCDKYHRK